jgi:hypothetical protein
MNVCTPRNLGKKAKPMEKIDKQIPGLNTWFAKVVAMLVAECAPK